MFSEEVPRRPLGYVGIMEGLFRVEGFIGFRGLGFRGIMKG